LCATSTRGDEEDGNGEAGGDAGGQPLVDSDLFLDDSGFNVSGRHDATFIRGDANSDGGLDLADAVTVLSHLFLGGPAPDCQDAVDASDDGMVDLSDGVSLVASLFLGKGPLPAPGVDGRAGFDPTADGLFCNESP